MSLVNVLGVSSAQFVVVERAELTVGGGGNSAPALTVDPQYQQAALGSSVRFVCQAPLLQYPHSPGCAL